METKIYLALSDPKDPPLDCFYTIPAGGVLYLSNRKEVKQKRESIFKRLRACLHGAVARSSGVGFFCFHALGVTKQKKPTLLDRGPPLHVNRVLGIRVLYDFMYCEKQKKIKTHCFRECLREMSQ